MITNLEPDILECEVKWALGSITMDKASGGEVELFPILKDDAVKLLHSSRPENLENSGHKTGKGQFSSQSQRKVKVKVAQSCPTLCDSIRLYSPWNSPGQNTGLGNLFLLQGIFPIQGSNSGLLHCWWIHPKERQCQKMFKLPHSYTHLTC